MSSLVDVISADEEDSAVFVYIADVLGGYVGATPYTRLMRQETPEKVQESKEDAVRAAVDLFSEYGLEDVAKETLEKLHGVKV